MIRFRARLLALAAVPLLTAGPAAAGDGKLEVNDRVITQANTGAKEAPKPAERRITGLLLPSRQEKVAAIQKRERDELERSRTGGFLAQKAPEEVRTVRREGTLLAADRRKEQSPLPNVKGLEARDSLPAGLAYLPPLLFVAAVTAAGYVLGKKYSRIFRTKEMRRR